MLTTAKTAAAIFSFVTSIDLSTPCASAADLADINSAAVPWPAANRAAAFTVEITVVVGMQADSAICDSTRGNEIAESVKPCRTRRLANNALARIRRTETVPSGQPSRDA